MHKPRQKARVARVLSYGKSHGKDSRKLTLWMIAFSFLLIASLSLLQVHLASFGGHLSVNSSRGGRLSRAKFWLGGGEGDGVQRMEQKMGSRRGSEILRGMEADPDESSGDHDEIADEDEGDRFEDMDNAMDMEDEEGDDFEGFGGSGDADDWHHHAGERSLLVESWKNWSGMRQQLTVREGGERTRGEDADGRVIRAGTAEAYQTRAGAANSASKKIMRTVLAISTSEFQENLGRFSSDDEPIDEETRGRLEHMSSIEDVLMLNNTESSGRIQDEQLLNKESRPDVPSDPMNPENNPLLQDPDSLSQDGGWLTKHDRALLKALILSGPAARSSFADQDLHLHASSQNTPDGMVEDDSEEGAESQFSNLIAGEHNELAAAVSEEKKSRRRKVIELVELLKPASDFSDTTHSEGEASSKSSSGVSKTKESPRMAHKKKEGEKDQRLNPKVDRRGYFPGYHPEVTFSRFLDEFLFEEKCSFRVFMAWMTPPWCFTVRHQRVLESLLYFHPTACVVVFSDTMDVDFFKSFTDEGYRIATVVPVLEELLQNTPTDVFATILTQWRTVDLFHLHYTELLRLGALYKYGGMYLDFDMIVLKPLTGLNNTVGSEVLESGHIRPNGAIMIFEKYSSFLNRSLEEFTATYDETLRDWNGADLLDRVMKAQPEGNDLKLALLDKPQVKPPASFFPLSSQSIVRYLKAPEDDAAIAEELELFNQILAQSFTVHLWNGLTFNRIPEPGSLVDKLMGRNCLHCTDIL